MAQPIPLKLPSRDPRQELQTRLEQAPIDHAEALLDGYELLQQLHNHRVLTALRGALGGGDTIVEKLAEAASSANCIAATRNVLILAKMLASIDPDVMSGVAVAVSETMRSSPVKKPPGLFALLVRFRSVEVRRCLAMFDRFLTSLGTQLGLRRNFSPGSNLKHL
jgi:uncharacterized protein YjgD (DUF1641 family)